jgi:hypothetical protein
MRWWWRRQRESKEDAELRFMHRKEIHRPGLRSDVEVDETAELLGLSGDAWCLLQDIGSVLFTRVRVFLTCDGVAGEEAADCYSRQIFRRVGAKVPPAHATSLRSGIDRR